MTLSLAQRIDLEKAAHDSGFEIIAYDSDGSIAALAGADVELRPRVTASVLGYRVILGDDEVTAVIAAEGQFIHGDDGAFDAGGPAPLSALLVRAWRLSRALPDAPLRRFEATEALADDLEFRTEVERLVLQRRGQEIFRHALMDYWDARCAITGIAQPELLRASHIKPWAHCGNNAERLDVYNGFLLTADWDAAFDAGLVGFDTDGAVVFSPALSHAARTRLGDGRLRADRPLTDKHRQYLAWHAANVFVGARLLSCRRGVP